MSKDNKKVNDLNYLDEETVESYLLEVKFEHNFYTKIAGNEAYEVIPVDGNAEFSITEEEKQALAFLAKKENKTLLFRVSLGETALVFRENGECLGIVPEYNNHGFPC